MEKKLTIYYTSDIHGCFSPIDYATGLPEDSGLANCMAQFRKDGNTLVIDGGDTLQGSPLTYYLSHEARDVTTLPAALLNLGGYDFVTLGNHDFDYGKQTIERYLAAYPTIQMVLDLHRDAAEDAGGVPVALTAYPDGEACAELMLVVGTDEGGLPHPDWQENLANALKLQALLNRSAPGLCRDLDLRTERFNQHETPGSLLVEVGASGNTLAEALRSARILGNALVKLIRGEEA